MKKNKNQEDISSIKERVRKGTLAPEVKTKLRVLSHELGISEENLAQLCVMMYRLYGKKEK